MTVRVYIPSSPLRLRDLLLSGGIGPAPLVAHAVTEPLRASYGGAGEEELEYAVLTAAAQDSVALLGATEPPRRVVVVAEVGPARPVEGGGPSLVEVDDVVPLRRVVAVHADDAAAREAVGAARQGLEDAGADAVALLDDCLDHELGWYATQETAQLLDDLGVTPTV
jgi:hypothetical protein